MLTKLNSEYCIGCSDCCQCFYLPGKKDELLKKELSERTRRWVIDDIIELTVDEVKAIGLIEEKYVNVVKFGESYYKCKLLDRVKNLCKDYENRPLECRRFPTSIRERGDINYKCRLVKYLLKKREKS